MINIQQDLAANGIHDMVFVGDRGMTSAQNMDFLESENVRFIFGKKLRDGDAAVVHALSTEGPMQQIAEGREFLSVVDPKHAGRRLVVVRNPARARRDAKIRAALVEEATERAAVVNASKSAHPRAACKIETTPGLSRLLKRDGRDDPKPS